MTTTPLQPKWQGQKVYMNTAIDKFIDRYIEKGGEIVYSEDGTLVTYSLAILMGEGLKTVILKEKYINPWSSGITMRKYNKIPDNYAALIDNQSLLED